MPNTCEIPIRALLSCFFIILREVDLENVSPNVRWNVRGVCLQIDNQGEIAWWILQEFVTPNSNAIILKKNIFFSIFCSIYGIYIKFQTFWKKKMIVIANVFSKLETVNVFLSPVSKNRRFGICFDSQHVKVSQILAKSPWQRYYHVFYSYWEKLILKMCPVLLSQILTIFLDTLTACSI